MKVCVCITARPSFSRVRSMLRALQARDVELQVVVANSALLERYGKVADQIRSEFPVSAEVWATLEGENLLTGARSTGIAMMEFASVFARLQPDAVCVNADRHEILAPAAAAKYMGVRLIHMQGGESTGSIDDTVRHTVTQLADLHLVSTPLAAARVAIMRYPKGRDIIHVTGCSSIDECVGVEHDPPVTAQELGGAGAAIDLAQPFLVCLQHPTTEHWEQAYEETAATLQACERFQTICFWPGQEAGSDGASKAIRERQRSIHTVRNLQPRRFLRLLLQASCLVGNSSACLRECAYLGVPGVNIGLRQRSRERATNVLDVPNHAAGSMAAAIAQQVSHGRYPSSSLYGDGHSGERMADVICQYIGNYSSAQK